MTPRERVVRALRRQVPDRMPLTLDVGSAAGIERSYIDRFRRQTGADDPAEYFDYDIRCVGAPLTATATDFSAYYDSVPSGTEFDEFGVGRVPSESFPLGMYLHPWATFTRPEQIHAYPFPTFELADSTRQRIQQLRERGYAVSVASGSVNEWCYFLRGMDAFMTDLVLRPELARAALERVAGLCVRMGSALAAAGADVLCFFGDVGGQDRLLMGPETWARWIQPHWRRIVQAVRRAAPQAVVFYHSCGYIEPIIPGLIEVGFDVLNPVQPECMDPVALKHRYGDRIALWGGIGMQSTMVRGSADEVRRAARALIDAWAPGGGAIVTAAQLMLPDVPWENVQALVETVQDHGRAVYATS